MAAVLVLIHLAICLARAGSRRAHQSKKEVCSVNKTVKVPLRQSLDGRSYMAAVLVVIKVYPPLPSYAEVS